MKAGDIAKNRGYKQNKKNEEEEKIEKEKKIEDYKKELLKDIEIDEENRKFIDKLMELRFSMDKWKTLIILGEKGTGKTYVTKRVFNGAYFMEEVDFKEKLSSGILRTRFGSEWGQSIDFFPLEALQKKKVVLFDDYGTGGMTETYVERMLCWINKRIDDDNNKNTIITTNLTLNELKKREARIYDRFTKDCVIISLSGQSRREKSIIKAFNY